MLFLISWIQVFFRTVLAIISLGYRRCEGAVRVKNRLCKVTFLDFIIYSHCAYKILYIIEAKHTKFDPHKFATNSACFFTEKHII